MPLNVVTNNQYLSQQTINAINGNNISDEENSLAAEFSSLLEEIATKVENIQNQVNIDTKNDIRVKDNANNKDNKGKKTIKQNNEISEERLDDNKKALLEQEVPSCKRNEGETSELEEVEATEEKEPISEAAIGNEKQEIITEKVDVLQNDTAIEHLSSETTMLNFNQSTDFDNNMDKDVSLEVEEQSDIKEFGSEFITAESNISSNSVDFVKQDLVDDKKTENDINNFIQENEVIVETNVDSELNQTLEVKDINTSYEDIEKNNENINSDETTTDILSTDESEKSYLIEKIKEKILDDSQDIKLNNINDLVSNSHVDIESTYAQIWQSQNIPELAASNLIVHSSQVSAQQASNNSVIQGVSLELLTKDDSKALSDLKETKSLVRSNVTNMMERVESAIKEIARSKDGKTISLKLNPEELGNIKVEVSYRDGKLTAKLIADNPEVSEVLREKSVELQQILKNSSIDVERVDVSISDKNDNFEKNLTDNSGHDKHQENKDIMFEENSDKSLNNQDEVTNENSSNEEYWVA